MHLSANNFPKVMRFPPTNTLALNASRMFAALCFVSLLACGARQVFAQTRPSAEDSLLHILRGAPETRKGELYLLLAAAGFEKDAPDSVVIQGVMRYAEKLERWARANSQPRAALRADLLRGSCWMNTSFSERDTARAPKYLFKVIEKAGEEDWIWEELAARFAHLKTLFFAGNSTAVVGAAPGHIERFLTFADSPPEAPPGLRERRLYPSLHGMLGNAHGWLGNAQREKGRYAEALRHYKQSKEWLLRAGEAHWAHYNHFEETRTWLKIGEEAKAMKSIRRYLEFAEQSEDPFERGAAQLRAGNFYELLKRYELALKYHLASVENLRAHLRVLQARNDAETVQGWIDVATAWENSAEAAASLGRADSSLAYFRRAAVIYERLEKPERYGNNYSLQGRTLTNFGRYAEAAALLRKAANILKPTQARVDYYFAEIYLGECYRKQGRYAEAKRRFDLVSEQFASHSPDAARIQRRAYIRLQQNYYQLFEAQGDLARAYPFLKRYSYLNDSSNAADKASLQEELLTRYEVDKKEREISALNEKTELQDEAMRLQRLALWLGGGALALLAAGVFLLFRRARERKLHNQALNRQKELLKETNDQLHLQNENIRQQKEEISAQAEQISAQRDDLQNAYKDLEELARFKDGVTGMLVHDLKNPLNAIMSFSSSDDMLRYREPLRQAARQMLNLTLDMLDVQKFEQAEVTLARKPVALASLADEALLQTGYLADARGQTLRLEADPKISADADADMLTRVLVNLLTNAIKYAPPEGRVEVLIEWRAADQTAEIRVRDNGPGIPADKIVAIFEKFAQANPATSGGARSTGLGLTFCKLAVEAHGGTIRAVSPPGEGATFIIELPARLEAAETSASALSPPNEAGAKTRAAGAPDLRELSSADAGRLSRCLAGMAEPDIFDTTELLEALDELDGAEAPELAEWREQAENAIFAVNEARLRKIREAATAALAIGRQK